MRTTPEKKWLGNQFLLIIHFSPQPHNGLACKLGKGQLPFHDQLSIAT
jgi:hypothetical protein